MDHACEIARTIPFDKAIIIGSPWRQENGDIINAALFIHENEIKAIIGKQHLPNYGVFDEKRVFATCPPSAPVMFKNVKLGIGICEDFWLPGVAQYLATQGADILISINGSPFEVGKHDMRLTLMRSRATETKLPLIYVNIVGGQDELVYDGGSFALDATGEITTQLSFFEEAVAQANDKILKQVQDDDNDLSLIYSALCLGLKDYVHKNGFKGVLLGLSGGIDSALSAVIAADALGAENVHCVMMPSPYTTQISLDDAAKLVENLGCSYDIIPITPAMQAYDSMLDDPTGLTAENIQSRIRGMTLMALSNQHGSMLLSTGNKSEMAVGYATLYGDMCGGFNALKDVYKTDVFALARWRNAQDHIIPERIITRPPSAELAPNQKDEDSLPAYNILDKILHGLIEERLRVSEITEQGFDKGIVEKVQKLLKRAEYKRRQAPPGVKITSLAFGRERRMPITNRF
jgi:NAD+ synthase